MDDFEDPQVAHLLTQLRANRSSGMGSDDCVSALTTMLEAIGADDSSFKALDRAAAILKHEFSAHEILHEHTSVDRHDQWYRGSADDARHWPALKAYLRRKDRDESVIAALDSSSDEIVSMLGDPSSQIPFQRRGLVVGYVQSGKTENMTAVVAKAVDAGYNMIVVLAGLTEKLRHQTQARFEKDLIGDRLGAWRLHTSAMEGGDFKQGGAIAAHEGVTHLLVLKKTTLRSRKRPGEFAGPLGKLEGTLRRTPEAELKKLRVLVIDDECDQATVNSATGEMDVSVINDCIRKTLARVHYVTYVGYTATPFANVLINPYPNDKAHNEEGQLDDLYPKSFITVLPKPEAYFGTERLFGTLAGYDSDSDEDGLPYVKDIPGEDEAALQSSKSDHREWFQPTMPKTLEDAILYFLACCAARIARGDGDQHMTMLIHTSVYKNMHERVSTLVEDWTGQQRPLLIDPSSDVSRRLVELFEAEQRAMQGHFPKLSTVNAGTLHDHLPDVLRDLRFPIENGSSTDRLEYDEDKPSRFIVTGGSILSRGLTLEGLVVSYFLRSTTQFDTLLQMGRWFGYRTNHEDLPRIWTTPDLQERFSQLADVEAHIRADIARYSELGMTPKDLSVRVPMIPGMAVTGAVKMKHARVASMSYDGQQEQTTRFHHLDESIVSGNWAAGAALLDAAESLGDLRDPDSDQLVWRGLPISSIRRFLRSYQPHADQKTLAPALLEEYLNKNEEAGLLLSWNVGVVSRKAHIDIPEVRLGPVDVRLNQRSRMKGRREFAWLKSVLSARDCLLDVPRGDLPSPVPTTWQAIRSFRDAELSGRPLLLLYPIDANSKPTLGRDGEPSTTRASLDAVGNLLGYAIWFPESGRQTRNFVAVDLGPPPEEDEVELMEAEQDMARAAGSPLDAE